MMSQRQDCCVYLGETLAAYGFGENHPFSTLRHSVFEQAFLLQQKADFILLQCGADSIKDDPLTHLQYSEHAHAYATNSLCLIADTLCDGKLIALGGGGYDHHNIEKTWATVVEALS